MDRTEMLQWMENHPQSIHGDPAALLQRCEEEVRQHAIEDAWLAAKTQVERLEDRWDHTWAFPTASGYFVARETCEILARELRTHEPAVEPGTEEHFVDEDVRESLEPAAWAQVALWVRDLAVELEHDTWKEIVRFTRKHSRVLLREGKVSRDLNDHDGSYLHRAAGVAHMMAEEYDNRAHHRTLRL